MKKIVFSLLIVFVCKINFAQNEPYFGGFGRGDVHVTQTNTLLGDALIYYGGVGRGDVHITQTNTLLGDGFIYYGGVGRGDVHITQTNTPLGDVLYYGGVGRGDVHITLTNTLLGDGLLYLGGIGRGDVMINKLATLGGQVLWRGGASGTPTAWNNAQNWWPVAEVPNPTTPIWIENNSNGHNPVLDQNRTVHSINFNGANKQFALDNYNLTVSSDVVGFDANNHFKTNGTGKLQLPAIANNASLVFPVGNSSYNPVTVTNNTGSSDNFSARVIDAVLEDGLTGAAILTPHAQVTWDITKGNGNANSGNGVDFTFQWNSNQELDVMPVYVLNHFTGVNWEIASGTSGIPTGTTVKAMTHTGYMGTFSPFAIGDSPTSALPVELIGIQVNCLNNGNNTEITWQTASEMNADKFIIERSRDGAVWQEKGTIQAAGTTNQLSNYSFTDADVRDASVLYYRLSQVDFDGSTTTYPPVSSNCDTKEEIVLFPNPGRDQLYMQLTHHQAEQIQVEIRNPLGAVISSQNCSLVQGLNLLRVNTNELESGQYFVALVFDSATTEIRKFVKID